MTEDNNNIDLRSGLADVIGLDWLRMFSSKELSTLVAGAEHDINVSDLQVCLPPSKQLSTWPFVFELSSSQKSLIGTKILCRIRKNILLSRLTPSTRAITS